MFAALLATTPCPGLAQSRSNLMALEGLAPVSLLLSTGPGKAALATNFAVTGAIQAGERPDAALLRFAEQQQQALRDAFITGWNAAGLADGLGTKLSAAYQARAHYDTPRDYTSLSPAVANLIAYTNETTASDSNVAKYFFANATSDGKTAASSAAAMILTRIGGVTDVFGKAYHHPAGSPGSDAFGNPRPFQTEAKLTAITGPDYFAHASSNADTLRGPAQDLTDSPSFPSGHTTYGTVEAMLLAILVPERYTQQVTRAAEYGNDRIILGAHYAMDVIAGRTLALHNLAHLLANNPAYVGEPKHHASVITDYPKAVSKARADMTVALQAACGTTLPTCATMDTSRFSQAEANERFYNITQTYGLAVVYQDAAGRIEDVGKLAPEAGNLLTIAFPYLTLVQADEILTATEGPGGGFLDNGSSFGVYSRLNLYAAAKRAATLAPAR